ncbi:hypothetical protein ACLB2K_039485 [Fragaria x ananassa]
MADSVWVSNEEIVVVSSSPSSDSDTLHRMEEGLDNLMAEIALDLGESIPVMDAGSHVSSCNPLLQEVEKFIMARSREKDDSFWEPPDESMTSSELEALRQNWSIPEEVLLRPLGRGVKFWDPPGNFTLVYEYQLRCGLMFWLPPFVQYTLACLHVAPGQVTPNMLKQILGTCVLFRLLKQEFPVCARGVLPLE